MPNTALSHPDPNVWAKQYAVLQEIHAIGMQILMDAQNPNPPTLPNHWDRLDQLWNHFQTLTTESTTSSPFLPDHELKEKLLKQAAANADLFRSLQEHCRSLQHNIRHILPQLQAWKKLETRDYPSATVQVKA